MAKKHGTFVEAVPVHPAPTSWDKEVTMNQKIVAALEGTVSEGKASRLHALVLRSSDLGAYTVAAKEGYGLTEAQAHTVWGVVRGRPGKTTTVPRPPPKMEEEAPEPKKADEPKAED